MYVKSSLKCEHSELEQDNQELRTILFFLTKAVGGPVGMYLVFGLNSHLLMSSKFGSSEKCPHT